MDKRFTMTVEEASKRYRFSAEVIRQNVSSGNWRTLDIHQFDGQGRIWLDPYNFDVWYNWMKRYIAASEKERRSRKWFAVAALLISVLGFLAFRPETLGAVLGTLAYGVIPTGLAWYLLRMRGVASPQYRHTIIPGQHGSDQTNFEQDSPESGIDERGPFEPDSICDSHEICHEENWSTDPVFSNIQGNIYYHNGNH